jgi:hypothetical protein
MEVQTCTPLHNGPAARLYCNMALRKQQFDIGHQPSQPRLQGLCEVLTHQQLQDSGSAMRERLS